MKLRLEERWLDWKALENWLDDLKATMTGEEREEKPDPKLEFLKALYHESKPLYPDIPNSDRVLDAAQALKLAKQKGLERWGSYFQRLLEKGGKDEKGHYTKVIMKQEAIEFLKAAGIVDEKK